MSDKEVIISSDLRYESCVAEADIDNDFIFRLNMDKGIDNLEIEFESENFLKTCNLNDFLNLIEKAKKRLLEEE